VDLLITRQRWSMSPLTAAGKNACRLGSPLSDGFDRSGRRRTFDRRIAGGDSFLREVLETGITLYAADDTPSWVGQGRIRLRRAACEALSLAKEVAPG